MDMEARSLSPGQLQALSKKIKDYKTDLNALKSDLRKASLSAPGGEAARAELVCNVCLLPFPSWAVASVLCQSCACGYHQELQWPSCCM